MIIRLAIVTRVGLPDNTTVDIAAVYDYDTHEGDDTDPASCKAQVSWVQRLPLAQIKEEGTLVSQFIYKVDGQTIEQINKAGRFISEQADPDDEAEIMG